jgi:uncharacterized damage-inducible protein DinB
MNISNHPSMRPILLLIVMLLSNYTWLPAQSKKQALSENNKTMEGISVVKNYAAYNHWANARLAEWLQEATHEQLHMEIESSFNTLVKTVKHLWNAEFGWLQTIMDLPWGSPASDFEGSDEELLKKFLETSAAFEKHGMKLKDKDLKRTIPLGKDKNPTPVEDIILHVFNHATYHRGQLITMGRQAGLSAPPRTDYIYYISL